MPGIKTEGVVLKRKDFGEADRILTIFTLHKGKLTVLARGVRKITSRRAGNVELLNRSSIFLHPGRNFYILTEAESLDTYNKLKEDLNLSTVAFHIIELVDRLTAENQENRTVYEDLLEVLKRLCKKPRQLLIRAFEAKILSKLGFWSTEEAKNISPKVASLLKSIEYSSWDEIEKMKIEEKEALELERILRYYLERVIEGKLKSREILKKLKQHE